MQKIIVGLFLILPVLTFSQVLKYASGGTVYNSENIKLDPEEVRGLMVNKPDALALYNSGRNKKTWGNVCLYSGLGLIVANVVHAANTDKTTSTNTGYGSTASPSIQSERADFSLAIIGGILVVVAIPIKIGFSKKVKRAVDLMNVAYQKETVGFMESSSVIVNSRGVGIAITF